jgi:hypothetical protein
VVYLGECGAIQLTPNGVKRLRATKSKMSMSDANEGAP